MSGTAALVRLILRRDRVLLPLWVILFAIVPIAYGSSYLDLFADAGPRHEYYLGIVANPSQLGLLGPVYGDSIGALTAWRLGIIYALLGLVSMMTVIRHTRAEEEAGRRELVGATVVGRQAPLAAAVIATGVANAAIGIIAALGLIGLGLPAGGSLALGVGLALAGWVFTGVGAVVAQLTEGGRAARGAGGVVLAVAYVLRAVGDSGGPDGSLSWLSWLSPIGWVQHARPLADERWWVFVLPILTAALLVAAASALTARRDIGAGVLPTRLGPAHAPAGLRSPFGLAWRLHRGLLISWVAGMAVFGAVLGASAKSVSNQVSTPELLDIMRKLGGVTGLLDAYFSTTMALVGLAASAYAISATLRLRTEEETMRAEPVLATSVSRLAWAGSHLVFGLAGPALAVLVGGVFTGLVYGASTGDVGGEVTRLVGAAAIQLPAVWVLTGLTAALFGLLPRLATAAWGALVAFLLLGQLGPLLRLDQWAMDLSPFTHLPRLPGGDVVAAPLVWLLALAATLTAAGLVAYRRRDSV